MKPTPFQHLLGSALDILPAPVRHLHSLDRAAVTEGLAEITAARNPAAWVLCLVAGLPKPGRDVPVRVAFNPDGNGRERWERDFAGRRYASTLEAGRDGRLVEHFGPFDLHFQLTPTAGGLAWSIARWRLLGVPLPGWSRPRIDCTETADGDRFVFRIDVAFPLIGPVVRYTGWLRCRDQS
jgi:hypothetical protein